MRASLSLFGQSQARSEGIAAEVNNAPLICWGKGSYAVWDKQKKKNMSQSFKTWPQSFKFL